jgi:hypothetical protein
MTKTEKHLREVVARLGSELGVAKGTVLSQERELQERQRKIVALGLEVAKLTQPVPMILFFPMCLERHVDDGPSGASPHKAHACQHCGLVWTPALVPTVGVRFLPGCKDDPRVKVEVDVDHVVGPDHQIYIAGLKR